MKKLKLASLINRLAKADQEMIKAYHQGKPWNSKLIRANTAQIKTIITEYGWPTIPLVGKKASRNAWLLAQHSDHDKAFQKESLRLLKIEYRKSPKNIDPKNIPYLEDRVLVHQKKKQLYGTQFFGKNLKLLPVKDPKNLDKRRKKFGLESMESMLKKIRQPRK